MRELVGVGGLGAGDARGDVEPLLRRVDREHPARAHQLRLDRVRLAERADADHRDRVAGPEARGPRHLRGALEAVGDGEDLRQHRHVVGQRVGHAEDPRARLEVEVLRPAAPQVRRDRRRRARCRSCRGWCTGSTGSRAGRRRSGRRRGSARAPRGRRARAACRRPRTRRRPPPPPRRSPRSRDPGSAGTSPRAASRCPGTARPRRGTCACRCRRSPRRSSAAARRPARARWDTGSRGPRACRARRAWRLGRWACSDASVARGERQLRLGKGGVSCRGGRLPSSPTQPPLLFGPPLRRRVHDQVPRSPGPTAGSRARPAAARAPTRPSAPAAPRRSARTTISPSST